MTQYMPGFGNDFETETLPGALPQGRNSPQRAPTGSMPSNLSGSPFTAPRGDQRALLALPDAPVVKHAGRFQAATFPCGRPRPISAITACRSANCAGSPCRCPTSRPTFIAGMRTMTTAGDVLTPDRHGGACLCRQPSMDRSFLQRRRRTARRAADRRASASSPKWGSSNCRRARSPCCRAAWCSRSSWSTAPARGYVCENYGAKFTLPDRGPIGANCLANPRDFKTPGALVRGEGDAVPADRQMVRRFHVTEIGHSPLDVVAWHGNYAPYKYDLRPIRRSARSCSTIRIRRSSRC